jgi:Protein of unknown function (DUF1236)
MRIFPVVAIAVSLAFGGPVTLADTLVLPLEISMRFHDDVNVKKYESYKWDGELKVGVIAPAQVEYHDVPDDVISATPALKGHKYIYVNEKVYIVDSDRKVVAVVN